MVYKSGAARCGDADDDEDDDERGQSLQYHRCSLSMPFVAKTTLPTERNQNSVNANEILILIRSICIVSNIELQKDSKLLGYNDIGHPSTYR